jgi:hypothetical protein
MRVIRPVLERPAALSCFARSSWEDRAREPRESSSPTGRPLGDATGSGVWPARRRIPRDSERATKQPSRWPRRASPALWSTCRMSVRGRARRCPPDHLGRSGERAGPASACAGCRVDRDPRAAHRRCRVCRPRPGGARSAGGRPPRRDPDRPCGLGGAWVPDAAATRARRPLAAAHDRHGHAVETALPRLAWPTRACVAWRRLSPLSVCPRTARTRLRATR